MQTTIVIVGGTGNLGGQIIPHLINKKVQVKVLVRESTSAEKLKVLQNIGVEVVVVNYNNIPELAKACIGASCILSVLSGLKNVIVDTQKNVLAAAIQAGVPRFISSDFSIDHRHLITGNNRNLDFRKEFYAYINTQPIAATSIFNGAFMDLLKTDMPLVLKKQKRILCWGNPNIKMEFTHTKDVAAFTAQACCDNTSPRNLFIAASQLNATDFVQIMSTIDNSTYKLFRPGSIGLFNNIIKLTKFFTGGSKELYPPWQGMQYMRDMMEGNIQLQPTYDNNKYGNLNFLQVPDFMKQK